jgi:poly(A) polymerase
VAGLARGFAAEGHELALVGGSVRDVFLGRRHGDLDLATDARPGEVRKIAAGWADRVWDTGIEFGTVGLRKGSLVCEITTYRSEEYRPESHKPSEVAYGRSLEADLARRDFTVNAIAARLPSLEIVDPFGGMRDLKAKVLRTPGRPEESFSDDPLRMLRAARFAAQLGFTVVPEVQAAMTAMTGRLSVVSAERIAAELTKLICSPGPDGPARGISVLADTGVAEQILPEVPRLRLEADEHVRHKDVYQHTLTVLARAATLEAAYGLENDLVLRLAALLHDIGHGPRPPQRAAVPLGRGLGRLRACRAAPAVPRLRRGGVDRFRGAALRAGRRAVADQAARADQGRLHDTEQGQGAAPPARLRRPGAADQDAVGAGGT